MAHPLKWHLPRGLTSSIRWVQRGGCGYRAVGTINSEVRLRVVDMRLVRKRFRVLLLAAIVAAVIVPGGFALSPELEPVTRAPRASLELASTPAVVVPVLLSTKQGPLVSRLPGVPAVPDAAKLLVVGAALLGLAAVVRKTI
jgi:hypothetical protein